MKKSPRAISSNIGSLSAAVLPTGQAFIPTSEWCVIREQLRVATCPDRQAAQCFFRERRFMGAEGGACESVSAHRDVATQLRDGVVGKRWRAAKESAVHVRVQRAVGFAEDARSHSARAQLRSGDGCQAPCGDSRGCGERTSVDHSTEGYSELLRGT